jgi:hypothetical protein
LPLLSTKSWQVTGGRMTGFHIIWDLKLWPCRFLTCSRAIRLQNKHLVHKRASVSCELTSVHQQWCRWMVNSRSLRPEKRTHHILEDELSTSSTE